MTSNFVGSGVELTLVSETFDEFEPRPDEARRQASKTEPECVAVVEDDERVRTALVFQIGTAGFRVNPFSAAEELLAQDTSQYDCVVADIFLPRMNGLVLQDRLKDLDPFVSIVFITGRGDLALGVEAMKRGAVDVLEKPVGDTTILNAIARGVTLSRAERERNARRRDLEARFKSLPARQREVFRLVTSGMLNKQVAAELRITERTVKVHRERLRRKMGADSLAELARIAEILQIHSSSPLSARV